MNQPMTPEKTRGLVPVALTPPESSLRAQRGAEFAASEDQRTRYSLPTSLDSASPIGFRTRVSLTHDEAQLALDLLGMERPGAFVEGPTLREQELFNESSLGIMSARQSTNFRGHRQTTLGPEESKQVAQLLDQMAGLEATPLRGAAYTHIMMSRPYRTPFTTLLTFIGHKPFQSLATVPLRVLQKSLFGAVDIPTVHYLQQLHIGIWGDALDRAVVIASEGKRRANVIYGPFVGEARKANRDTINELEKLAGLSREMKREGWRICGVAQAGYVEESERFTAGHETWNRLGANVLSFRSERILPGINADNRAPEQYQSDQGMEVPEELAFQAGRAAYNAFTHVTGTQRERSKELLLLERIDNGTETGRERMRWLLDHLCEVSDQVIAALPKWIDLPTGRFLSKNAAKGKKAFALAGQRVYIGGLDRRAIRSEGIDWDLAIRAVGASAARSALVAEWMGVLNLPEDCDLLAGVCLMAGPVNQNDIGKSFFGHKDLLCHAFPDADPTSLLVWTLKAKTVSDPIGNEEQLLNPKRKGQLVDLRPGPHEVVSVKFASGVEPLRLRAGRTNDERAYSEVGNFVTSSQGIDIPGNRGEKWPTVWANERLW